jgi:hypothetical protein
MYKVKENDKNGYCIYNSWLALIDSHTY